MKDTVARVWFPLFVALARGAIAAMAKNDMLAEVAGRESLLPFTRPAARALSAFFEHSGLPVPRAGEFRSGREVVQCFLSRFGLVITVSFPNLASSMAGPLASHDRVLLPLIRRSFKKSAFLVSPGIRPLLVDGMQSFEARNRLGTEKYLEALDPLLKPVEDALEADGLVLHDDLQMNVGTIPAGPAGQHAVVLDYGALRDRDDKRPARRFCGACARQAAPVQAAWFADLLDPAEKAWPASAKRPDGPALKALLASAEEDMARHPDDPQRRLYAGWLSNPDGPGQPQEVSAANAANACERRLRAEGFTL